MNAKIILTKSNIEIYEENLQRLYKRLSEETDKRNNAGIIQIKESIKNIQQRLKDEMEILDFLNKS